MSRTFLIPVLMVLLVGVNSPGLATNIPTIELERAVHFLTPGEKDLLLQPGEYQVGAAEEWLELIPVVGDKKDAILIDAEVLPHEEEVPASQALSIKGENKDWHYVVLLLPGGRSLQALGTYTGIRPRSTEGLSRKRIHSAYFLATSSEAQTIKCKWKICQKWNKLRAKCYPAKVGGKWGAKCEVRFSRPALGFTVTTAGPDTKIVSYNSCRDLSRAEDIPQSARNQVLNQYCREK